MSYLGSVNSNRPPVKKPPVTSSYPEVQIVEPVPEPENYEAYFPKTRILCLNITMALFHTALFVVTLTVGKLDLTVPIYMTNITFQEANRTDSQDGPAFELVPSYTEYGDIYLTIVTAAFFFCSGLAHGGNAFLWRKFYEDELSVCRVTTRWIEYFFSASLMILIIAFNAGIREYLLLLAITFLIASTMPFGLITEIYARPVSDTEWNTSVSLRLLIHSLGYIPQLAAWGLILANFYSEKVRDPPAFVYGIIWGQLALFFSFGFVQLYQIFSIPANYYKGEIAYQWLSLGAKGLLGVLLLSNVLVLSSFDEIYD